MIFMDKIKSYLDQNYIKLERKNHKKDYQDIRDNQKIRENNIMLSQRL